MKDDDILVRTDPPMTTPEMLHEACYFLEAACDLLFDIETAEGKAAAFMTDCALRYCDAALKGEDPRLAQEFWYERNMDS